MAPINISAMRKSYGSVEVIKGVSIDVADGEFVALVGPSGCGKSTLLRMIAGLEAITDGTLLIGNVEMNSVRPKDRNIAMVFQSYALYPHMTVAQNMGFSLRLRKTPRAEFDARVRRAAEILGLSDLLERYPRQLSGGQRQRVAMGRAIVRDPAVFLFDEPLSNLDAKLRVQTRAEIKSLHQRLRTTTVYVTHDQVEAMTLADRIVVMNAGLVEQVGTPLELYDRPKNRFVAGFLGSPSMNFFDGKVEVGSCRFVLGTETALDLKDSHWDRAASAVLGVRPESIVLDDKGTEAEVLLVEPTGADTQIVARWDTQIFTAVLKQRFSAPVGARVKLGILPGQEHLFDPVTELRLDMDSRPA